jgi:hypothetical protein
VVDVTQGFIRVDNRIFCSITCSNNYLEQQKRFDYTTRTLMQDGFKPLNYKPNRWWEKPGG